MNQQNKSYKVLGLMSGTSFDGLDLCLTEFQEIDNHWVYTIICAETKPYTRLWKDRIINVEKGSGESLIQLHFEYGKFLGDHSIQFLKKNKSQADLIASHGHTIFHQINKGFTFQLGHGASIAAAAKVKTVADFRSLDVALQGEGAPLVPFGDEQLFGEYGACLNLGGIANISFQKESKRVAFDIAPANMVLNYFYKKGYDKEYDKDGQVSKAGNFNHQLFEELNKIPFYSKHPPKSLGKEWVYEYVIPIIEKNSIPVKDKLHTYSMHLIHQIENVIIQNNIRDKILVTGGGAHNTYLTDMLKVKINTIKVPEKKIVEFKESIIFAFLGLLRFLERENTLKSVTGASQNSSGGSIYLP